MSAMRSRSITLGFLLLLLWATVTYFLLFHHSPDTDNNKKQKVDKQINELEKEINQLLSSNSKLIQDLKKGKMKIKYEFRNASLKDYLNINKEKNLDKTQNSKTKFLDDKNSNVKTVPPLNPQNSNELMNNLHLVKHKNVITKLEDGTGLPVIAVLVISCNRITVRRCIDQLLKYRPNEKLFPIIVSQDCSHQQTTEVIRSYGNKIIHIQQPDQSDIEVAPREKKFKGYFKIARHYGWALNQIFFGFGFDTAIIVEDDLDIAPDFFEYFLGTHSILIADSSLWCISAWNDNGKAELVDSKSPHLLYRTDFFPGLGWMLTRKLWEELSVKWPKSYWDDWIRQPEQRKNRACIRPEISRTRTFGKIGVSNGLFYEKHLQFIKLNDQFVPFTKMNLTYLLKENYDLAFVNEVYKSEVVTYADLKMKITTGNTVRIPYYTRQFYKSTAKILGLMDDFKSGVPRTGYRGVVTFFYNGRRVYLAPSASWSGYDISWS